MTELTNGWMNGLVEGHPVGGWQHGRDCLVDAWIGIGMKGKIKGLIGSWVDWWKDGWLRKVGMLKKWMA